MASNEKKKNFMVLLEEKQLDQLRILSKETGLPMSYMIRSAITQFIEANGPHLKKMYEELKLPK
jgi:predicted DNA-binding protein